MLPPFIIEQIRRREEEERRRQEDARPRLQLPIEPRRHADDPKGNDDDSDRGVVIVDLMG
ncbi:MAG: hypothetical protein R3B72_25725 [Polyangiaceae bacterium]